MTTKNSTSSILSASGARALLGSSILARLPLAMFSIALLVNAQHLTGSFAVAGAVSGAYAIAGAVSAPLLGRLVDRCGQTTVLVAGATVTALMLVATGLAPSSTPPAVLVALAAAAGMSTPPLSACVRTLLPAIGHRPEPAARAVRVRVDGARAHVRARPAARARRRGDLVDRRGARRSPAS